MDEQEHGKGKTETLILSKKDEQERVQKKTFTNWVNTYLIRVQPPYKIVDICENIKDGLCLIHLLEAMTGEKLKHENPRNMQRIHKLANINAALDFLKQKKIKLVNINATDIADGKPAIVLGLVWTVILFFQIEEQEEVLFGALGEEFKGKGNAKKALLGWVNKTIGDKYNLNVTDFGSCWRDGKAFSALVHNIDPSLIDWNEVQNRDNQGNLAEAFRQAEELRIPHILDPQDVDVERPDEKSIMTYITQFLKAYPDGGNGIDEEIVATKKMQEESAIREREEEEERQRIEAEKAEKLRKEAEEMERKRKEDEEKRRLEEAEQRRRNEEEKKRKEEEERMRRDEEERRKKNEEEKRKREEEERKRKEEEERQRLEKERKRKEEEERKRLAEEDRIRKEEERRQREEAERKRKEEEERKRKEEEERKRKEEEERKRKEEEERKRKEEEERKRKEEEERKRKEEEERKRKEEEERKRKEEEERIRKEEEKKLKEQKNNREKLSGQLKNIDNWIEDLQKVLDTELNCDNNSIVNYLNNLNKKLDDLDQIDGDLSGLKEDVKSGLCGSDYVKPFLSDIMEFEKKLKSVTSRANSVKDVLGVNNSQLKTCETKMNNVLDWTNHNDDILKSIDNSSSPQECDLRVNELRAHLSEEQKAITALRDAVDFYNKLKSTAPKNLNYEPLRTKIEDLEATLKKTLENTKGIEKCVKNFNTALTKVKDFQKEFDRKLPNIDPASNEVLKLKQQLEKIEKLKAAQSDGDKIMIDLIEKGQRASQQTADLQPLQNKINSDTENCEHLWDENMKNLDKLEKEILSKLEKCEDFLQSGNKVEGWFKEKENKLRNCKSPCESMSQKEAQIDDLNKLQQEIDMESPFVEKYLNELEEMAISDPIAARKLSSMKQQRANLNQNIKDAIELAKGKMKNHEEFNDKLDIAEEWLDIARNIKADATSKEKAGNIEELQRRKDLIDQLLESKKNGELLIKAAVSTGECAAKDSSSKGKEDILNVLRGLNKDFIQLFDGLSGAKQAIEAKLNKTANIKKELDSLTRWTEEFDQRFANVSDGDIDKMKELYDNAQSKLYSADNTLNQAKSLDDEDLESSASYMKDLIKTNLENAQQKYGLMKENQKTYNDFTKSCSSMDNWFNDIERKVVRCGESSSSNVEEMDMRRKALEKISEEIKAKRNDLENINSRGNELAWSSPSKSAEINSALDNLNEKYQHLMEMIEDIDSSIENDTRDQKDFEDAMHKANRLLSDTTQQLLKCSDTRRCTPGLLSQFSSNIESIMDQLPQGEEIVMSAIRTGQCHLDHLRKKSIQSPVLDRDNKKVNELDKNWHDLKKQVEQVQRNLSKVKDNVNEFEMLKDRIQGYIEDKEKLMRNPPSSESFKYILDEMEGVSKDVELLQKKANDVGSSLSNSDAPIIAKGLTERYNNLKRAIEEELGRAKKMENDWAAYKNALNACEKWIVDSGFRLIDHDFCAVSPEDAQIKLDECIFMSDEIKKFKPEVEKVKTIGKHVAEEIVQTRNSTKNESSCPQHSESEIETDSDHLENSYHNVLENAHQTRGRLEEQLNNWRKYRDLVQNNDKYLTGELVEWWREKKYCSPQTLDDINRSVTQAEDILQNLMAKQAEMKIVKSNCQSALPGSGSRRSFSGSNNQRGNSSTTPLSRLAENVESSIEANIEEIKKYIPKLQQTKDEWKSFEKEIEELEMWTKDKENTFETKIQNPSLKSSSLNDDQRADAERLKKEIDNHEKHINDLLKRSQTLGKRNVNPLLQRVEDLKRSLKRLLERKDEEVDTVDFVKKETVSYLNSEVQFNSSETIATQTPPERCSVSTSTHHASTKSRTVATEPKHVHHHTPCNGLGLRNSGGNRGLSKMLYPYCCTSDLLNMRPSLDYLHGPALRDQRSEQKQRPTTMMASKVRNGSEESVRRNWMKSQNFT